MAHPKGVLIERLQKDGRQPQFRTEATGPDHEPTFLSDAIVEGEVLGTGQGGTKRDAEKRAAEEALRHLDRQQRGAPRSQAAQPQEIPSPEPKGARSQGRRGRRKGPPEEEPAPEAAQAPERVDGPFEGPWPIFEDVLAAALEIANDRLDRKETGETAVRGVRDLALDLYKGTLESLGDVVELEDDED